MFYVLVIRSFFFFFGELRSRISLYQFIYSPVNGHKSYSQVLGMKLL